jgi:hypothetical protein
MATPDEYDLTSSSRTTAESEEIILEPSREVQRPTTRRVLRAKLVGDNPKNPEARLAIDLVYQKRHSVKEGVPLWDNLKKHTLHEVEMGSELSLSLDTAQTLALRRHLNNLYDVGAEGIPVGREVVTVVRGERAGAVEDILRIIATSGEDAGIVLQAIAGIAPGILETAALAETHRNRTSTVEEFSEHLSTGDWDEGEWEHFFKRNRWIFGHGLDYRFTSELRRQPYLGGMTADRTGGQRGDYLCATVASTRFTVLVELKTPAADLVRDRTYRTRVHELGHELTGGVCQLQSSCCTWETKGAQDVENVTLLEEAKTWRPKGILVIGTIASLDTPDKQRTFELFRRGLHNLDVITFDELLERAKLLLAPEEAPQDSPPAAPGEDFFGD